MSHDGLMNFYQTNFQLMQHHNYSLKDIEEMLPYEREIYIGLLKNFLKEQEEQQAAQQR